MDSSRENAVDQDVMIEQGDTPIGSIDEDRLGRRPYAEALAAEIMAAPATRGYVMGLTGPWGSGKTSILNMTVDALGDDAVVVQFNPWMFSGTEALVSSFFEEIGKQLDKRDSKLKGIADKLATYGHLLSPLASLVGAGTAVSGTADIFEKLAARSSVFEQREEVRSLLEGLERRLVVIVDDVDRLRPQEVLDIVRLVRLVGDFPNTLYLLAFDRGRVEECLGEGDIERGRAYLEKIVQVTHDVPAARQPDVTAIFLAGLQELADRVPTGPLDAGDWQNIFAFIVRPLLGTPRHVRRLLGSLSMTMRLVGDEVALADLIGMEALRVLRPAMFEALVDVADYLSTQSPMSGRSGYQQGRNAASSPIGPLYQLDPELATNIFRWLFPAARSYVENLHHGPEWEGVWRRQRKVASAAVLRFYLERQLPAGVVPARAVADAVSQLGDRQAFRATLEPFSAAELLDLIERVNTAIEELPLDTARIDIDPARQALPVLLDLIPRLPEDGGLLNYGGTMTVMRATLRLLRRITDEGLRADIVRAVLDETETFTGRWTLLLVAGHRKNIGNGLIDVAVAKVLEDRLRADLVALPAERFASESSIVRLADLLAETAEGRQALQQLAEDDRVMLSLFAGSVGQTRSHAIGAAAVEVTKVLSWDQLATYFDADTLIRRTAELLAAVQDDGLTVTPEEDAALALACDYATGNRPETSFDRIARMHAAPESPQPANARDEAAESGHAEDLNGDTALVHLGEDEEV
jgi:hypothetical protein